jgi:hypothetical protein
LFNFNNNHYTVPDALLHRAMQLLLACESVAAGGAVAQCCDAQAETLVRITTKCIDRLRF